jgi:hypothetical protein
LGDEGFGGCVHDGKRARDVTRNRRSKIIIESSKMRSLLFIYIVQAANTFSTSNWLVAHYFDI